MSILKNPITSDDHIEGNHHAPVTLVEYGDYECPYCGMAYPIVKEIQEHFGDQLRFVFRNFPLAELHPHAEMAAETAEFAGVHRHFWEMHDLIYANQDQLSKPFLVSLGQQLKLPSEELELAIDRKAYEEKIRKDFIGGVRSGVNGTPTFFINDVRYNGLLNFEGFIGAIHALLIGT